MAAAARAVAAVAAFVMFAAAACAQSLPVDFVGGVAASETSADHATLATARIDAGTPRFFVSDGWNIRGVAQAGWQPLFTMRETTPEYREGLSVAGGFRIAHTSARLETALVGRIGSTRAGGDVGDAGWFAFFESGVNFRWFAPLVDVYAGLRHDDRLQRTGALSNYRDPTGRALLSVSVFPLQIGRAAAGVSFESETALPGTARLPSGFVVAALARVTWRR